MSVQIGAGPVPNSQLVAHGSQAWMLLVNRVLGGGARFVNGRWESWQPGPPSSGGSMIAASTTNDVVVIGSNAWGTWPGALTWKLFASSNGGATFDGGRVIPQASTTEAVSSPNPGTIVIAGSGNVEKSTDGGASWTVVSGPHPETVTQLGFTTTTQGLAVAKQMWMTYDGGGSWVQVNFPAARVTSP